MTHVRALHTQCPIHVSQICSAQHDTLNIPELEARRRVRRQPDLMCPVHELERSLKAKLEDDAV
jgi:hypothetical protein